MLCMSTTVCLFVVFLCRPVDNMLFSTFDLPGLCF